MGFPQATALQALLQHGFITRRSCFRHCSNMCLHGQQHPSPFPPQDIPSPWAPALARTAPEGDLYELCLLQAPSITNPCASPQLEICSMQSCILWAAGQPVPLWASPGLQEPVALRVEHLFLSSTDAGGCRAISSHFFTLLSQIPLYSVFYSILNLLSQKCKERCSRLCSDLGQIPFGVGWIWLLYAIEHLWGSAHRGHPLCAKKYEPILCF